MLCLVLPTYVWMSGSGGMMFGFLWGAFAYCFYIWVKNNDGPGYWQKFKQEWNWDAVTWAHMKPILFRWIIATILICGFTFWYEPERLFSIPRESPQVIPFLILAYPILSALPQEFIFCSFFMNRYGWIFEKSPTIKAITPVTYKIVSSAIVFGYAHMLFLNWVAPVFSFFGGLIFAYTYIKTRSLALVTIEHGLYGNSIFMAGIGYYFYSGAL